MGGDNFSMDGGRGAGGEDRERRQSLGELCLRRPVPIRPWRERTASPTLQPRGRGPLVQGTVTEVTSKPQ